MSNMVRFYLKTCICFTLLLAGNNCLGQERIPPVYKNMTAVSCYDLVKRVVSQTFYVVDKDNKKGLLDENGRVIIEPLYRNIELLQRDIPANWEALFRVENMACEFSVFNSWGKQLLPFEAFELFPVNTHTSVREERSASFVERIDTLGNHQFINLITGNKTDWYGGLNFIGDEVFTYSRYSPYNSWKALDWQVLDSNFNLLYSSSDNRDDLMFFDSNGQLYNATVDYAYGEIEGLYIRNKEMKVLFHVNTTSPVSVIHKMIEPTEKELKQKNDRFRTHERDYYSLLNSKAGKQSLFIYKQILRVGGPDEVCYWGIRVTNADVTGDEVTVDVYDSSAVFLQTVCMEEKEFQFIRAYCEPGIDDTAVRRGSGPTIPIENNAGVKSAVRINGTRVVE